MEPFTPLINLLVVLSALSVAAERATNVFKLNRPRLATKGATRDEEKERERSITQASIAVSIGLALVMKGDFFALLVGLGTPWETLGWARMEGGMLVRADELSSAGAATLAVVGSVVTGFALGFGSKFWHDLLDIVFETRERIGAGADDTVAEPSGP
ncbi:MAG TPA: hypothetical protein VLL48_01800 [Longimicrobiales bacterium]|nr:hypothetical protein [Longimicrobiales bacterium]